MKIKKLGGLLIGIGVVCLIIHLVIWTHSVANMIGLAASMLAMTAGFVMVVSEEEVKDWWEDEK
ncbi:MAG: hypothetical protein LUE90_06215 [Clostridiales bacterium]|nr:hypothetical protein [Clostridiales bacterium]